MWLAEQGGPLDPVKLGHDQRLRSLEALAATSFASRGFAASGFGPHVRLRSWLWGLRRGGVRALFRLAQGPIHVVLPQPGPLALRTVQQAGLHRRAHLVGNVMRAPDIDHGVDALFDETQSAHDFGHALSRDVLELASGVDVDRVLVEPVAELRRDAILAQRPGDFLDVLGCGQNLRGCLLGGLDDLIELFRRV